MKTVYLVRHGQAEGNLKNFSQFPETELTEAGHEGARALADRFTDLQVDSLVVSPYTRAQQTANYISEKIDLPMTTADSFHEVNRPLEMRGETFNEETEHIFKRYYSEFWSEVSRDDGGERFCDVLVRMKKSLRFLEAQTEENIAVVSHGHYLRTLVVYILNKNEPKYH
jgi:broad specificity phosphatase PhoE